MKTTKKPLFKIVQSGRKRGVYGTGLFCSVCEKPILVSSSKSKKALKYTKYCSNKCRIIGQQVSSYSFGLQLKTNKEFD